MGAAKSQHSLSLTLALPWWLHDATVARPVASRSQHNMVLTLVVPEMYPYTLLSATAVPFVTSFLMGGKVMTARKTYDVPLPNLYATPGVHEKADAFNRVQRGHQVNPLFASALVCSDSNAITSAILRICSSRCRV